MTQPSSETTKHKQTITVGEAFSEMKLERSHILVGSILFVTFVIDAWEQVGLVYVSHLLSEDFGVGMAQVGTALGAVALGMVPGTILWAALIEKLGKKNVAIISLLVYGVVATVAAMATNFTFFVVLRFVSGIAFAGVYAVTIPYFMELLPTKRRGQATVALSMGFPLGVLLCIGTSALFGEISWRVVAIIAAVAAAWAIAIWKFVPESPYWLVKRGRKNEAKAVIRDFGLDLGPECDLTLDPETGENHIVASIKNVRTLPLMTLIIFISFTYNWAYWGLQAWLPVLLQDKGLSVSTSLGFVAVSQVVAIPGYLLAAWATRRYGRRWVFVIFALCASIGGLIFGNASGMVQLYLGNFMFAFFILGSWGIWNTWRGEAMPTKIRGAGYSLSNASLLAAQAISVPVVGWMMDQGMGAGAVVGSIAIFMLVSVIGTFGIPETEGKALR